MMRDAFRLLAGLAAAILLIMGVSLVFPASRLPTAHVHPEIPSLLHSTGGLAEQPETLWLGYLLGVLIIATMAACVWVGYQKRNIGGPAGRWLIGGFMGYALIFTALTVTYHAYTRHPEAPFVGGFPVPTAWMVYGMWLFPLFFVGLYMLFFDRWILTEEDEARFKELVDEQPQRGVA